MFRYKMIISYDGTGYGGWQSQPNSICIQDIIESVLTKILRQKINIVGSGRTDAGVHALGQVAHFDSTIALDLSKCLYSANSLLSNEIRIFSIEETSEKFHARYSATGKTYQYRLHLDRIGDPFKAKYALHVKHKIDIEKLYTGSRHFIGTHDFSAFANQQHKGSAAIDGVRTIKRLDIIEEIGGIRLEYEGDGFLYKMVRNITGTLLDVASGKISVASIPEILQSKDRKQAGRTAEAHGLCLVEVYY
jgi:tRNA pseudouridine38-40 synthase